MNFKHNCMVTGHHRRIEQASNECTWSRTNTRIDLSVRHRQTSSRKSNLLEIVIFCPLHNNWFEIKHMRMAVCTRRSSSPLLQAGIGTPGNEARITPAGSPEFGVLQLNAFFSVCTSVAIANHPKYCSRLCFPRLNVNRESSLGGTYLGSTLHFTVLWLVQFLHHVCVELSRINLFR